VGLIYGVAIDTGYAPRFPGTRILAFRSRFRSQSAGPRERILQAMHPIRNSRVDHGLNCQIAMLNSIIRRRSRKSMASKHTTPCAPQQLCTQGWEVYGVTDVTTSGACKSGQSSQFDYPGVYSDTYLNCTFQNMPQFSGEQSPI
jgi:hypothetical protein